MKNILLFIGLVFLSNTINAQDSIEKYNSGIRYFNNELYDSAIVIFDKLIKEDFDKANDLYFYRGFSLSRIGEFEKALKDYNTFVKNVPDSYKGYYYLGANYYILGEYNEAKKSFSKSIEINPEYSRAIWQLGATNEQLEQFDQALKYFNKAISLDTLNVEYYFKRAMFLKTKYNDINKAGMDFFKVLQLDRNYKSETVLTHFIDILITQKYFDQANKLSYALIDINKDNPLGYYYRGLTHLLTGRDGCDDLKKAYQLGYKEAKNILDKKECQDK